MIRHHEKRGHKRKIIHFPISYVYSDEPKTAPHRGTIFDLGNSGMSFYTNTPLKEGLSIQAHTHAWDAPKACIVKWRSKKSRNIYKVGVSFK